MVFSLASSLHLLYHYHRGLGAISQDRSEEKSEPSKRKAGAKAPGWREQGAQETGKVGLFKEVWKMSGRIGFLGFVC